VETGRLPGAYDGQDAARLLEIATSLLQEAKKGEGEAPTLDEAAQGVLKTLAYVSGSELNPIAAFLGGVVGQEVVKAVSRKFSPLQQWFYFDSIESLPDEPPSAEEIAPLVRCQGWVFVPPDPLGTLG
jgi:ubiquitin-activating enzyme E1